MIIHNVALVGLIVVSVLLIIVVLLMSGRTTGLGALQNNYLVAKKLVAWMRS